MSSIYNNYFLSNKVKVFPCAYRNSTYDATARLNTEYNFTHLPHTVDKESYIIKFDTTKLICVIHGYYFEITLDAGDYSNTLYNKNKYLNICVASPNSPSGTDFIESPHLCSWAASDTEADLDYSQAEDGGSTTVYLFGGLQISDKELSRTGYQCYALKLDASAKLPISASKIENSVENSMGVENGTGVSISKEFTTKKLTVTDSLNEADNKFTADLAGVTVSVPVTINSTLDVKPNGTDSVLTATSEKVVISKPTEVAGNTKIIGTLKTTKSIESDAGGTFGNTITVKAGGASITGVTTIKGTTEIKNSSSIANDGNLTVAGTGGFGGKLTVSKGGASITGETTIAGKLINTDTIDAKIIQAEKISVQKENKASLVIDKAENEIIKIKNSSNKVIFSVDTESGETFADKIKATVEGISKNAIDAKNVTDTISSTNITDIFGSTDNKINKLKLRIIEPDTDAAYNSSADQSVKIILKKNTDPEATKAVSFFLAKGDTATVVEADEFKGTAHKADAFALPATISLTNDGDIEGSAEGIHGWSIRAKIGLGKVTNDKLKYDSITIGENEVVLGESIGDISKPFRGTLCFGGLSSEKDCKIVLIGQYKKSKMEFPLEIKDGSKSLIQFTNNYGASDSISVPKQIIYAATTGTSDNQKGRTELFGDKICIYNQGYDYTSGTIEAGTIDLSANNSNIGLKISGIHQIKVNGAGLKSSSSIKIVGTTVKLCDNALVVASGEVKIGSKLTLTTSNGNIESKGIITATSFNATSDRRLKENIIDYKPEKSILDLPVKKFDFISGPKNQIGCIAQDLKEICPEIVNEDKKGYLSIQESKLVYLLLDEVKKLRKELDKIKK